MGAGGREGAEAAGAATPIRRRLLQLMVVRLAICAGIFAFALALIGVGDEGEWAAEQGLYATVACAFLATVLFGAAYGWVRNPARLGAAQLAADVGVATALVHFSGGSESLFSFLYVPITVYGAFLFGRLGAYAGCTLSAVSYGVLLLARSEGWLGLYGATPPPGPVQLVVWGVHAGALLVVALLASTLARELDQAGRALDERTRDLRHLRSLHRLIVESLTSGLLTIDPTGRVTSFNPEAEQITGVEAEAALGEALDRVIPGAWELVRTRCDSSRRSRLRTRLRVRNRRGEELHLGLSGSILREVEGRPHGYVVIFQDVTRVVEMERELRQRERLAVAGQLAANLAHEIRNPLAAISGSLQMLGGTDERRPGDPESGRLMGIVLRETDRLNQLITDFLEYARPGPPRRERIRMAELLEEVLQVFESVRPCRVKVVVQAPRELAVLADGAQLRQLLWNLFLNAVQAMPEGGELLVAARAEEPAQEAPGPGRNEAGEGSPGVEIRVADTGVGIPEEVLDRIFEPFFTSKKEGSGLGLATVHRIVESNGGQLGVESAVGRGTTFRIRLPRAEGEP